MLTKLCTDEKKYSILIGSNKERPVMYKMFQLQDCIFISHDVPCTDDWIMGPLFKFTEQSGALNPLLQIQTPPAFKMKY